MRDMWKGVDELTGKTNRELKELLEKVRLCDACKNIKDKNLTNGQLEESNVSRRFHVYSNGMQTRFMFIMEKPGEGKGGVYPDQSFLDKGRLLDFREYVERRQKAFIDWIYGKNKSFATDFFNTVNKVLDLKKPIDEKNLFEHFHVSDVQKCRDGTAEKCFNKFLKQEIELLQPDLIFCFGKVAWNRITKRKGKCRGFDVKPAGRGYNKTDNISQLHGRLFNFKIDDKSIWIMPCIHFSGSARNTAPRKSYIVYIHQGLKKWTNIMDKK